MNIHSTTRLLGRGSDSLSRLFHAIILRSFIPDILLYYSPNLVVGIRVLILFFFLISSRIDYAINSRSNSN
jgi:hypothetical protein